MKDCSTNIEPTYIFSPPHSTAEDSLMTGGQEAMYKYHSPYKKSGVERKR